MKKIVKRLVSSLSPAASIALELKKRPSELYPPNVRNILKKDGTELVKKITIVRTPVESFVQNLMQVISLGKFKQAVKKTGYDDMFHLSLIINDKYTLDKQEVVKLVKSNRIPKNAQIVSMDIDKYLTLSQLVDDTKKKMGNDKFSNYSAKSNNCQDFLLNVLTANKLNAGSLDEFIKQDSTKVFKELPKITDKLANVLTDVGAVANKIVEGEGKNVKKDLLYSKKMPYDIVKEGRCWMVINKKSKKVHAKCTTKKNAQAQLRILEDAKMSKGKGSCVGICEGEGMFDKPSSLPKAEPKNKELEDLLKTFYDKIHATNLPKARVLELYHGALAIKANKKMAPQDKILVLKALMAEDHLESGVNTNNPVKGEGVKPPKKIPKMKSHSNDIPPREPDMTDEEYEEHKERNKQINIRRKEDDELGRQAEKDMPAQKGTGVKKTSPWISYVKKNMTGMKGKSQQEIRDHMRKIAAEWKKMK